MPVDLHIVRRLAPGFLGIMPHPSAPPRLADELHALRKAGVDVLVSLLAAQECAALGLGGLRADCAKFGIEHLAHPVADMAVPTDAEAFTVLALTLKRRLVAGAGIAIHCRAGIGRSGLLAASVLVALGASPGAAFAEVSQARGASVPEVRAQGDWLAQHQHDLLGH